MASSWRTKLFIFGFLNSEFNFYKLLSYKILSFYN
nr:MAG TPA: PsbA, PsbB, PsbC, PsbD, PsbE-FCP supercomplex, PLANT PROTEIN [Caudoviricetes sp.]